MLLLDQPTFLSAGEGRLDKGAVDSAGGFVFGSMTIVVGYTTGHLSP